MAEVKIKISGVAVELALGHYLPTDTTIMNDWTEFYNYNQLIHTSQLIKDYITDIEIQVDGKLEFSGAPLRAFWQIEKSISPVFTPELLYLRTECAEKAVYELTFQTDEFDIRNFKFCVQDYDGIFRTGDSFLTHLMYNSQNLTPEWVSGTPVGNMCVLCRYENGYLIPMYDAIKKVFAKK